ncbi:hypothetical protein HJC23_006936 [Cyclotella cryptica]|uniref:Homeobox domain-containing protein n=1 Tax=Cyclotella cryptica TaxID=29204 RepID=A0ABD3P561_9STRA
MDSSAADILREFASQASPQNSEGSDHACQDNDDNKNNFKNESKLRPSSLRRRSSKEYEPLEYLNPHVRIHPTEMHRYLHNLMRNTQENNIASMSMSNALKPKEEGEENDMASKMTCGDVTNDGPADKTSKQEDTNNIGTIFCSETFNYCGEIAPPQAVAESKSSSPSAPPSAKSDTSTSKAGRTKKKRPSPSSSSTAAPSDKQENYKSVDVLHDGTTLIARFLTQTECASYLRATPEAVSYHCSKGGGICNGLIIRPTRQTTSEPLAYGLFAGAEEYRPKERPQLNKDSVKILKEWLLSPEHVDNPYPNQSEMNALIEKTGLDRMQLKHWFNNARKRILKPFLKEGAEGGGQPASGGGKKRKTRKGSIEGSDPTTSDVAATVAPAATSATALSASNPFFDDSPAITASDERPRMLSDQRSPGVIDRSIFGVDIGSGPSNFDPFRSNAFSRATSFGRDPFFGPSPGGLSTMGFNNDQGMMMGSSSTRPFTSNAPSANPFAPPLSGFNAANPSFCQPAPLAGVGDGPSTSLFRSDEEFTSVESTRSNALFKQQVAAMAMNEANIAFADTEEAYARAKELYARSSHERPEEEDPRVMEANAVAKRCQSVAMFKLKVSQRANEEAAKAFAKYQQVTGGGDGFDF